MAKEITQDVEIKTFRREVDAKLKDAEALERDAQRKQEALEKRITAQTKKLADEQAVLEKLERDYAALADKRQAAAEAEEAGGMKRHSEELKSGKIDVSKFQALKAELREAKEAKLAALKVELADSLEVIRAKDAEVAELERELLTLQQDFYYLEQLAPSLGLQEVEALLKQLSVRRHNAAEHSIRIRAQLAKVEDYCQRAQGKGPAFTSGQKFDSLDLAGVKGLRFRASIPARYSPLVEKAIGEISANEEQRLARGQAAGRYSVTLHYAPLAGTNGRVDWLCENVNAYEVVKAPGLLSMTSKQKPRPYIQMAGGEHGNP